MTIRIHIHCGTKTLRMATEIYLGSAMDVSCYRQLGITHLGMVVLKYLRFNVIGKDGIQIMVRQENEIVYSAKRINVISFIGTIIILSYLFRYYRYFEYPEKKRGNKLWSPG